MAIEETDQKELILHLIDSATHPDRMTPAEALEFLMDLRAEIADRSEALQEENDL